MTKKIGVVFSGFGSQFVGMGKDVYDDSRAIQEYFEEAYNCLGLNFVKLCFASSDEELAKISNAYLAIFLTDISLYSLLLELGIQADVLAGYGIGRYAALYAAGGFSFPDGLYLINKYSNFYQDFLDHNHDLKMLAISGIQTKQLRLLCEQIDKTGAKLLISAIYNDIHQLVVGNSKLVDKLEQALKQHDSQINIKQLDLAWGLHSEFANQLATNFKIYFGKVDFKDLVIPVLSSVNGKLIKTGKAVKKDLIDQELKPILWDKVVHGLIDCDVILEVGPGHLLADQLRATYPEKIVMTLNKKEDLIKIKALVVSHQQDRSYEE
jgi:[acyl-carrier-protein] S-malonyltransferase